MYIQTKLSPNEFTKLILKARGSRREALEQGWGGPQASISTAAIGHSNPYFSAVKYLHFRRCVIVTTLNKASVLDEV